MCALKAKIASTHTTGIHIQHTRGIKLRIVFDLQSVCGNFRKPIDKASYDAFPLCHASSTMLCFKQKRLSDCTSANLQIFFVNAKKRREKMELWYNYVSNSQINAYLKNSHTNDFLNGFCC